MLKQMFYRDVLFKKSKRKSNFIFIFFVYKQMSSAIVCSDWPITVQLSSRLLARNWTCSIQCWFLAPEKYDTLTSFWHPAETGLCVITISTGARYCVVCGPQQ